MGGLVKLTKGAVQETAGYLRLEPREMLRTGNVNLGVIRTVMLLKTLKVGGLDHRKTAEGAERSPEVLPQVEEEKRAEVTEKGW